MASIIARIEALRNGHEAAEQILHSRSRRHLAAITFHHHRTSLYTQSFFHPPEQFGSVVHSSLQTAV